MLFFTEFDEGEWKQHLLIRWEKKDQKINKQKTKNKNKNKQKNRIEHNNSNNINNNNKEKKRVYYWLFLIHLPASRNYYYYWLVFIRASAWGSFKLAQISLSGHFFLCCVQFLTSHETGLIM